MPGGVRRPVAGRTSKVKVPKRHGPPLEDTWLKLAKAISEIQRHNASKLSFEEQCVGRSILGASCADPDLQLPLCVPDGPAQARRPTLLRRPRSGGQASRHRSDREDQADLPFGLDIRSGRWVLGGRLCTHTGLAWKSQGCSRLARLGGQRQREGPGRRRIELWLGHGRPWRSGDGPVGEGTSWRALFEIGPRCLGRSCRLHEEAARRAQIHGALVSGAHSGTNLIRPL